MNSESAESSDNFTFQQCHLMLDLIEKYDATTPNTEKKTFAEDNHLDYKLVNVIELSPSTFFSLNYF
jgi:hypothetical protein